MTTPLPPMRSSACAAPGTEGAETPVSSLEAEHLSGPRTTAESEAAPVDIDTLEDFSTLDRKTVYDSIPYRGYPAQPSLRRLDDVLARRLEGYLRGRSQRVRRLRKRQRFLRQLALNLYDAAIRGVDLRITLSKDAYLPGRRMRRLHLHYSDVRVVIEFLLGTGLAEISRGFYWSRNPEECRVNRYRLTAAGRELFAEHVRGVPLLKRNRPNAELIVLRNEAGESVAIRPSPEVGRLRSEVRRQNEGWQGRELTWLMDLHQLSFLRYEQLMTLVGRNPGMSVALCRELSIGIQN